MRTRCLLTGALLLLSLGATLDRAAAQSTDDEPVPQFIITTVAGTGECGRTGEGGPATDAQIQRPTSVAIDSVGNVYIADERNQRICMVSSDGVLTTVMGAGGSEVQHEDLPAIETNLMSAYGVAVDRDGNLYVISRGHSKIFKVGKDGIARRIVGSGERGYDGDGGLAIDATFNNACHLVVDDEGNLFIADTGNHCVRKVSVDGVISTVAGTGEEGFSGDGGPAVDAQLAAPAAIAIDGDGALYVADFLNHRIRKILPDGTITTIAGTGERRFNGDGGFATESNIGEPTGVAVDEDRYVYIGDQINKRVRVVTPEGVMHTVAGTGRRGYSGDGGLAHDALTSNPDIIAFDSHGDLFVTDHLNCVVRKLTRVPEH